MRKWLIGGLAALGGIAVLATVGFAIFAFVVARQITAAPPPATSGKASRALQRKQVFSRMDALPLELPDLTPAERATLDRALRDQRVSCEGRDLPLRMCVERASQKDYRAIATYVARGIHEEHWSAADAGTTLVVLISPSQSIQSGDAPASGPAGAPVVAAAFTTPACCRDFDGHLRELQAHHARDLRAVWMIEALPSDERRGRALVAGRLQGRFADLRKRQLLDPSNISQEEVAGALGLDVNRFVRDLESASTLQELYDVDAQAKSLHLAEYPSLWINGRRVPPHESADRRVEFEIERSADRE